MSKIFWSYNGYFQDDIAPCHKAQVVSNSCHEHDIKLIILHCSPQLPDQNAIEHLLDSRSKNLQHQCASDKSAVFKWHNYVSMDQNHKGIVPTQCEINATKLRLRLFWEQSGVLSSIIMESPVKRPVSVSFSNVLKVNIKALNMCMWVCVSCSSHLCMASLYWVVLWFSCNGGRTSFFLTSHWGRVWTATLNWEREKGSVKTAAFILVEVLCCVYGGNTSIIQYHWRHPVDVMHIRQQLKQQLVMKCCNIELVVFVYAYHRWHDTAFSFQIQ